MNDDISMETGLVLRRDRRGRVQRTAAQRAEILAEYDRSGLSGPAFARVAGLSYPTLASWLQKRREAEAARSSPAGPGGGGRVCFVPVVATSESGTDRIEVRLPGEVSVWVATTAQARLAAVLLRELSMGGGPC